MKECQDDIVQICRRAALEIQGIVEIHWGAGLLDREVVGSNIRMRRQVSGRPIGMETLSHWWLLNT